MPANKSCLRDSMVLMCVLLAASCAGMINRSEQRVPVTSAPAGAAVFVNGVRQGVTPLGLDLSRKHKAPVIRIESPGYDPVEIRVIRKTSGFPFFGNIAFGLALAIPLAARQSLGHDGEGVLPVWLMSAAAIGAVLTIFDATTGSINEFEPREIVVTMKKANGPPEVETILLDERDFRNIKWIRVRGGPRPR